MFVMVTLSPLTPSIKNNMDMRTRVLIVEDEVEIRQLIALHLKREGFHVDEVGDGEQARLAILQTDYHLLVLDWMVPTLSGLELTRWVRRQSNKANTSILFVTAKAEAEDVAAGLNAGADDFLTKPFDNMVLMARVNALLRRQDWLTGLAQKPSPLLSVGELTMNTETYEVQLSGQAIELTRSEFRLLETLMQNQGKVLSREVLIEQIQGEGVNVVGRTVDTHVFGLRKKLGSFADCIETIRGVGYRVRYVTASEPQLG